MKVLVIVDMQNDFIDGSLGNIKGKEVLNAVLNEIDKDYDTYLLTRDSHEDNYLETYEGKNLPIKHCIKGSDGWNINSNIMNKIINSKKPHYIFDKNSFGSFDLANYIENKKDIDSITIVGLCSDICVISNALILRAKLPNIPIYYIEEAMYATSKENQDAAIAILKACQIYNKQ